MSKREGYTIEEGKNIQKTLSLTMAVIIAWMEPIISRRCLYW